MGGVGGRLGNGRSGRCHPARVASEVVRQQRRHVRFLPAIFDEPKAAARLVRIAVDLEVVEPSAPLAPHRQTRCRSWAATLPRLAAGAGVDPRWSEAVVGATTPATLEREAHARLRAWRATRRASPVAPSIKPDPSVSQGLAGSTDGRPWTETAGSVIPFLALRADVLTPTNRSPPLRHLPRGSRLCRGGGGQEDRRPPRRVGLLIRARRPCPKWSARTQRLWRSDHSGRSREAKLGSRDRPFRVAGPLAFSVGAAAPARSDPRTAASHRPSAARRAGPRFNRRLKREALGEKASGPATSRSQNGPQMGIPGAQTLKLPET